MYPRRTRGLRGLTENTDTRIHILFFFRGYLFVVKELDGGHL